MDKNLAQIKYDLCVVGTGPSAYFFILSVLKKHPECKIIVIEAGSRAGTEANDVPISYSGLPPKLSKQWFSGYGGTSNLWHGVLAPMDQIDFEKREWVSHSGWPITLKELEPYYCEASQHLGFDFYETFYADISVKFGAEASKLNHSERLTKKIFYQPKKILRTHQMFEKLLREKKINILFDCVALEFLCESPNKSSTVTGLKVGNSTKKTIETVRSGVYVSCAGCIGSTRLMHNSKNISTGMKNIGKYLMDHPMGNLAKFQNKNPLNLSIYSQIADNYGMTKIGLRINETLQYKEKTLNSLFYVRPSYNSRFNIREEQAKLDLITVRAKLKKKELPVSEFLNVLKHPSIFKQILGYKFGINAHTRNIDVLYIGEQSPSEASFLSKSSLRCSWGYPGVNINWKISETDSYQTARTLKEAEMFLTKRNNMILRESRVADWTSHISSAAHLSGTLRMAQRSSLGVVDKNLKVFSKKNLYICDGSVLPTIGNANTTLTLCALSCRLGKSISLATKH